MYSLNKINNSSENLYPNLLIKKVNEKLNYYLKRYEKSPDILRKAINYSIKNGGKRFRPILCLLTAKSLGNDYENVFATACAIEFIHTYSLIHDDLPSIDNDNLRRGRPTCHRVFGEDIAILTGDALFAEAFNIIFEYQKDEPRKKLKVLNEIISATGALGMVAGQIVDVFYTGKKITKEKLNYMHENKTGKLITASVRCGAILSKASKKNLDKLTEFSKNIGIAFQITDDILDISSSKEEAGKTVGKDKKQKKNTFPSIWGIKKSKEIAEGNIERALVILRSMDIDCIELENIAKFLLTRKT